MNRTFLFSFFILVVFTASAQQKMNIPNPVKWEFSLEQDKENKNLLVVQMTASVDKAWHIYSQQVPEDGPIATSFKFNPDSVNFILSGTTTEPAGEKKMDNAFGVEIKSFEGKVIFSQKINRVSKNAFKLTGEVEYMTCNDMQCLPPKTIPFVLEAPAM